MADVLAFGRLDFEIQIWHTISIQTFQVCKFSLMMISVLLLLLLLLLLLFFFFFFFAIVVFECKDGDEKKAHVIISPGGKAKEVDIDVLLPKVFSGGFVGFGTGRYYPAQFDSFSIDQG